MIWTSIGDSSLICPIFYKPHHAVRSRRRQMTRAMYEADGNMVQQLANCHVSITIFNGRQRMGLVANTKINTEHMLRCEITTHLHTLFFNLKLALRFCGSSCDLLGSRELSRDLRTIPCRSFPNLSDFVLSLLSEIISGVTRGAS